MKALRYSETSCSLLYQSRWSYVPEDLNLQTTIVIQLNSLRLIILRPKLFYCDDSFPCGMDFPNAVMKQGQRTIYPCKIGDCNSLSPTMDKYTTVNQTSALCKPFSTSISDYSRNDSTALASLKIGFQQQSAQ